MNVSVRAKDILSRSQAVLGFVAARFIEPDEVQAVVEDSLAHSLGLTDQERYVSRNVCYKAEQGDRRGQMIDGVFHAHEQVAASVS